MTDITYENVKPFKMIEFELKPEPTPLQEALSNPTTLLLGAILVAVVVVAIVLIQKSKGRGT